jgi:hypothetical protein
MALERKDNLAEEMASFKGEKMRMWETQFKNLVEKMKNLIVRVKI